jgi:hypothetical protein
MAGRFRKGIIEVLEKAKKENCDTNQTSLKLTDYFNLKFSLYGNGWIDDDDEALKFLGYDDDDED